MIDDTTVRVIAELGQAAGDLGYAVDAAAACKRAGAWGCKIQVLDPDRIASADASRYWATQPGGATSQRDTFRRNGVLDPGAVVEWFSECRRIGIEPLATPFDTDAVAVLVDAGSRVVKVASGDITYRRLLDAVAETGLPVLLSTGASTDLEVQRAWQRLRDRGCPLTVPLACALSYPCPDDQAMLRRIPYLRASYGPRVGYSDHTLGAHTALAAAALGAVVLEKHVCCEVTGAPDDDMALGPAELADYVTNAELGRTLAGSYGFHVVDAEKPARVGARRSVRWARDLDAGHVIGPDDVVEQRPADDRSIDPWYVDHTVGGTLLAPVKAGAVVTVDRAVWRARDVQVEAGAR